MLKAKFIGVPGERHETLYMYGQQFPLGEFVPVVGKMAAFKLANHPHFTTKGEWGDKITDVEAKAVLSAGIDAAGAQAPTLLQTEPEHVHSAAEVVAQQDAAPPEPPAFPDTGAVKSEPDAPAPVATSRRGNR